MPTPDRCLVIGAPPPGARRVPWRRLSGSPENGLNTEPLAASQSALGADMLAPRLSIRDATVAPMLVERDEVTETTLYPTTDVWSITSGV